jgi:thioredoxin family protein
MLDCPQGLEATSTPRQRHGPEQRVYQLVRQSGPIADRQFEIEFLDAGVETFAFAFGRRTARAQPSIWSIGFTNCRIAAAS